MATLSLTSRHDLTDVQWQRLAPLLPAAPTRGRPLKWEIRQLIDDAVADPGRLAVA
ncbi:hypothetical protein JCM9533A_41820 [Catenuloplanes niger JCM 9533]|uniref:Transposase n=1 Tax=Catenuloplanes niger TaxID=587534 RepID=A0AAE3ZP93_9ACTN|nr:transposase [Catenuloplanes niger]